MYRRNFIQRALAAVSGLSLIFWRRKVSDNHGWISVEDRLPEEEQKVIVFIPYYEPGLILDRVETATYVGSTFCHRFIPASKEEQDLFEPFCEPIKGVTFWRPILLRTPHGNELERFSMHGHYSLLENEAT